MWKSVVLMTLAFPLSALLLVIFWVENNLKSGVVAACSTFALCMVAATLMLFFVRRFSIADVFLPLAFSILWSMILFPLSLGTELFTAPAAIGSGLVLTLCLWRAHHHENLSRYWLIFPFIVYVYEMLPINIPGPFDDYFSFGGDVVCAILYFSLTSLHKELPAAPGQPD
jgi:hypothetical protein